MLRPLLAGSIGVGAAVLAAAPASAQELETELFVQGLASPVDLTFAPGDPSRIFIVEQAGRIRIVENGTLLPTPFLDIDPIVRSGGERGLLGLAFHPDYQNNGRFFVNYTNNAGNTRVEEYQVSATDPNIASPTGIQFIASISQDFSNHNGGCIRFGPDGKLYVGMGDGGSGNDPNNRSQNPQSLLGKMLRYDVDLPSPFIPVDNPFVGDPAVSDAIWHLGVRNPWRFDFDRDTGDLWIADVGQNAREEVSFLPAGLGGQNLGWRCKEGTRCTNLSGCSCADATLIDPIHEYPHSQGCSISGGVVYRGSAIAGLQGTYFFADFCSSTIWSLEYDGTNVQNFTNRTQELRPATGNITQIVSFGADFDGEVYIVSQSGGRIWKIIEAPPQCEFTNYCDASNTSLGNPAIISAGGSASVTDNDLTLSAFGIPFGSTALFFYGPDQTFEPSGAGNLCVNGNAMMPAIRLYPALTADNLGSVARVLDLTDPNQSTGPGAIAAGMTLNFQCYFRDAFPGGPPTWNFTDAVSILFCP
ncbi:MAG: PQQ-dependent sugar dehydrogenase [Planctomycetota bacterium]